MVLPYDLLTGTLEKPRLAHRHSQEVKKRFLTNESFFVCFWLISQARTFGARQTDVI